MGVDAADVNGDGRQDLFVANVDQEMFSLYRNNGNESFSDVAAFHGVARPRACSGWGLKFFDYDNDGNIDLFLANGHPDDMIDQYSQHVKIQGTAAAVPQRRPEAVERQRRSRSGLPEAFRRGAWRSATTTTTAGWTFSSATTAARRCC